MPGCPGQAEGAVGARILFLLHSSQRARAGGARMTPQPHLTGLIIVIVIGAGALHAVWNAIAKHLDDRVMVFALMGIALTLGGGLAVAVAGLPGREAALLAVASAVIHIGYDLALMNSYRLGSFNQVYPIARGTSPLVVAAGAYFFADEHLGVVPLAGLAVLAFGLMSLAVSAGRLSRSDLPAIGVAVLTGLTIAGYTIVDGLGVRAAHDPYSYAGLMFLLQGPVFPLVAVCRRPVTRWRDMPAVRRGLLAGALSVVAYGTVLWAQSRAPLAEVAAIRETSVIFAALIGMMFLKERLGTRRMAAAIVVAAGIVLISA
jgi:drug/metabolite transporter (DMT)-like permease